MYQMCGSSSARCAPPPPQPRAEEQAVPNHPESIPQTKPRQAWKRSGSGFPQPCSCGSEQGCPFPEHALAPDPHAGSTPSWVTRGEPCPVPSLSLLLMYQGTCCFYKELL